MKHNISFLNAIIGHPRFISGELTTNFINEEYPDGFGSELVHQDDPAIFIAAAAVIYKINNDRRAMISDQLSGHEYSPLEELVVIIDNGVSEHQIVVGHLDQSYSVSLGEDTYVIETDWCIGEVLFRADINGRKVILQVDAIDQHLHLFHRGAKKEALVVSPRVAELSKYMLLKEKPDMSKFLISPMPGLLVKLAVKTGDIVKAGEEIAVIEAMKMENSLCATSDGEVLKVSVNIGDILAVDQLIVEFK